MVLHNVTFADPDTSTPRPILHRMSLAEMCVPYAEPRSPYTRKCAFDVGDYGLGYCANSLQLGCDCLGNIHYFDAVLSDSKGAPTTIPNAVCLHEEDAGLLWKHVEYRNGHVESRRQRRLVVSFVSTVVNYEYAFYWSFYLDGSIQLEIKLTGMQGSVGRRNGNVFGRGVCSWKYNYGYAGVLVWHGVAFPCAGVENKSEVLACGQSIQMGGKRPDGLRCVSLHVQNAVCHTDWFVRMLHYCRYQIIAFFLLLLIL